MSCAHQTIDLSALGERFGVLRFASARSCEHAVPAVVRARARVAPCGTAHPRARVPVHRRLRPDQIGPVAARRTGRNLDFLVDKVSPQLAIRTCVFGVLGFALPLTLTDATVTGNAAVIPSARERQHVAPEEAHDALHTWTWHMDDLVHLSQAIVSPIVQQTCRQHRHSRKAAAHHD